MAPFFSFLEHPSDIGILAQGSTREEAVVAASQGLVAILVNPEPFHDIDEREIRSHGADEAAQIVNWLNEIVFYFDTESLVFTEFVIDSWMPDGIIGRARGERFDPDRHEFRTSVKAATYHQFESKRVAAGWEIRVFVDV